MLADHSNDPKLDLSYGGTDETNKYSDVFCLIMTFALTTLGSQAKEVHETAYLEHNSDFITIKFESIDPRLLTNKKTLVLLILNTPYDVQLKTYEIALKPILRRQFVSIPL